MTQADFSTSLAQLRTEFEELVKEVRPDLHRYCTRIVGSAVEAEDVVQDALAKAFYSLPTTIVTNMRGWLVRIAHNRAIDHLRKSGRERPELIDDIPMGNDAEDALEKSELLSFTLSVFLGLTVKQRSCVVLKDVMNYSLAEISELLDATISEIKASLHRGRARLRELAKDLDKESPPPVDSRQFELVSLYVDRFNARDFDAVRQMLADDVRLDLVNRLQRRGLEAGLYFDRYQQVTKWSFAPGVVEGRPAVLVYDKNEQPQKPYSFILLEWEGEKVSSIRDYIFVPYVIHEAVVREV